MSNITIEVEGIAGSSIDEVCQDAVDLANRIKIMITFKFNDVLCIANPGDTAESLSASLRSSLKSEVGVAMGYAQRPDGR